MDPIEDLNRPPGWANALPRLCVKLAAFLALLALAYWVMGLLETQAAALQEAGQGNRLFFGLIVVFVFYAILIAIPFVPGVEIALALLMIQGHSLALPIYLATLMGLFLAFMVGRLIPIRSLKSLFLDLHLTRAARLMDEMEKEAPQDRSEFLVKNLPPKFSRFALRFKYVALALLINLPGSSLIGGGGGICMAAGISGLFTPRGALITMAIAIAPFPLFFWLAGTYGWAPALGGWPFGNSHN